MDKFASSVELTEVRSLVHRHLLTGWLGLALFLTLGIALETCHGLKLDFYLDLRNSPRRMLWTLAHSHGTLFSLINLAFAWTVTQCPRSIWLFRASWPLVGSLILMPLGFFGGGVVLHGGDPNISIVLVPVGALLLLTAVFFCLLAVVHGPKPPIRDDQRSNRRRSKN